MNTYDRRSTGRKRACNMYVKNGNAEKIELETLNVFCTCPVCKKEVLVPEWAELVAENGFDVAVYCDSCSDHAEKSRTYIRQHITDAVQHMNPDSLQTVLDLVARYAAD